MLPVAQRTDGGVRCFCCCSLRPVLGNSLKGKLVEAIQGGDVRRLKGEYGSSIFASRFVHACIIVSHFDSSLTFWFLKSWWVA